jgi:hypothetical protein
MMVKEGGGSDAADGFRDAGDLRGLLQRAAREEVVEFLGGDDAALAHAANGDGGAFGLLLAQVADDLHVASVRGPMPSSAAMAAAMASFHWTCQ